MDQRYAPGSGNGFSVHFYKDQMKKEATERRRNVLHLILKYLRDYGLFCTAEALSKEATTSVGMQEYAVCDNIDLDMILQEYQAYFHLKFHKELRILKKTTPTNSGDINSCGDQKIAKVTKKNTVSSAKVSNSAPILPQQQQQQQKTIGDFAIDVVPLLMKEGKDNCIKSAFCGGNNYNNTEDFLGEYPTEWREMAELVMRQAVSRDLGVTWKDCVGLEDAVEFIQEAVIYPVKYSEFFTNNKLQPWRGVLLYGPPGTGKTLLAQALGSEAPSVKFFNVTCSVFVSKWRGDSEKMVKILFEVARFHAPSVIFIDEIDALASSANRNAGTSTTAANTASGTTTHEASKRFHSELLVQMDGIIANNHQQQKQRDVFVLATTNVPWAMDPALLRRFEKRIFVPLPSEDARIEIFRRHLAAAACGPYALLTAGNMEHLGLVTKNFSGSDIRGVCKEAQMAMLREHVRNMNKKKTKKEKDDGWVNEDVNMIRKPSVCDVRAAIEKARPSVDNVSYQRYLDWQEKYGTT